MMENASKMVGDHMRMIWYNWMVVLLWVFCFTISSFAAAVVSHSSWYGFLVVWDMLLLVAFSVGGTMIIRNVNYRTPLAVGFLIGSSFMVVNLMLLTAVVSGSAGSASGIQAVTAFASLLLIFVGSFTVFVTLWRDTLLPPPSMVSHDAEGLPPPQFSQPSYGGQVADDTYGGSEHADVAVAPPASSGGVL